MVRQIDRFSAIAVGLAVLLCAACQSSPSSTSTSKTLIIDKDFSSYDSLDPARGVSPTSLIVDKAVYQTLLWVNPNDLSKPYPQLATSFSASPDGKAYTFQLRQGVKFASGNPLTSADVVFSIARIEGIQGIGAGGLSGLTATAPDPNTVVIMSSTPNPAIPVEMTQFNAGILDSKLVQAHGGTTDTKDQAENYLNGPNLAGAGPYMLSSVDRTSQIILKTNPNYWGDKPTYSTLILRNTPAATQRLDIQDGQAQVAIDIATSAVPSLDSSKVNVIAAPTLDGIEMFMNARSKVSPLTANQNFRDAVRYGLDYKGILALAGPGAVQSTGFIPVGVLGSLPIAEAPQRDLVRARAALAKLGIANPTLAISYPSDLIEDGVQLAPLAAKIQSDLKDVGIAATLVGAPFSVDQTQAFNGTLALWFYSNSADYPDPSDFLNFVPGGYVAAKFGWNPGIVPNVDALVSTASTAIQPADRGPAYQALGRAWNDVGSFIMLFQPGRVLVTAKSVHVTMNPFTYIDLERMT